MMDKMEQLINKLESAKTNINTIPVVGYDSCIKVVKAIAEILEVQQDMAEYIDRNKVGVETEE